MTEREEADKPHIADTAESGRDVAKAAPPSPALLARFAMRPALTNQSAAARSEVEAEQASRERVRAREPLLLGAMHSNNHTILPVVRGILSAFELGSIFGRAGFKDGDHAACVASVARLSRYFRVLPDGRVVVIRKFHGDIEDIPPLGPVDNLDTAVSQALNSCLHGREPFNADLLAAALEHTGHEVTRELRAELDALLEQPRPGLTRIGRGRYMYVSPDPNSAKGGEQSLSIPERAAIALLTPRDHILHHPTPGLLSSFELVAILAELGVVAGSTEHLACVNFIAYDPRFHVLTDGRIVLRQVFKGSIDDIPPLTPITGVTAAINEAAAACLTGRPRFSLDILAAAMQLRGYHVEPRLRRELLDYVRRVPRLRHTGKGIYTYHSAGDAG